MRKIICGTFSTGMQILHLCKKWRVLTTMAETQTIAKELENQCWHFGSKLGPARHAWQLYDKPSCNPSWPNLIPTPHPQCTLYAKCLKDLTKCIEHQWIVLFSATDNQIHSLKFYLTHFVCVDLKKRGLHIRTSSNNDINALCTQNLTLFNIQTYLDLNDASQFYAPHSTVPPTILHKKRDLKH